MRPQSGHRALHAYYDCDLRALLETHRGFLSVQEHGEETLIDDVDVVKPNATKNQRTWREFGDQRAFFDTSWHPLEALLEPSWGTVGAYQFDMLNGQP